MGRPPASSGLGLALPPPPAFPERKRGAAVSLRRLPAAQEARPWPGPASPLLSAPLVSAPAAAVAGLGGAAVTPGALGKQGSEEARRPRPGSWHFSTRTFWQEEASPGRARAGRHASGGAGGRILTPLSFLRRAARPHACRARASRRLAPSLRPGPHARPEREAVAGLSPRRSRGPGTEQATAAPTRPGQPFLGLGPIPQAWAWVSGRPALPRGRAGGAGAERGGGRQGVCEGHWGAGTGCPAWPPRGPGRVEGPGDGEQRGPRPRGTPGGGGQCGGCRARSR